MDQGEFVYTFGMETAEMNERLRAGRVGVLSLASGGDSYAVPVAYHYDGARLYLRLGEHDDSEKMAYLGSTARATFLLHEFADPSSSWSIVVRGRLHRLADDAFSEAEINERFAPIRVFGEDIGDLEQAIYEIEIEEATGRVAR